MDGVRSSPRKSSSNNQRAPSSQRQQRQQQQQQSSDTIYGTGMQDEEFDAVGGLLRSIQKPLSSIGRIFSDDGASSSSDRQSPPPFPGNNKPNNNNNNNSSTSRERTDEERQLARAEREALKRASVEAEEGRKARARELRLVVE